MKSHTAMNMVLEQTGWSVGEMAERCGVSENYIRQLVRGDVSLSNQMAGVVAEAVEKIIEVRPVALFCFDLAHRANLAKSKVEELGDFSDAIRILKQARLMTENHGEQLPKNTEKAIVSAAAELCSAIQKQSERAGRQAISTRELEGQKDLFEKILS